MSPVGVSVAVELQPEVTDKVTALGVLIITIPDPPPSIGPLNQEVPLPPPVLAVPPIVPPDGTPAPPPPYPPAPPPPGPAPPPPPAKYLYDPLGPGVPTDGCT